MAVFGAEQIQRSQLTSRYFVHYMIAVNMGGIIGTLAISFIQIDTKSYFIGYLVAAIMLLVAFLLFITGYKYKFYIHEKHSDTVITKCIPVVKSAFQSWYKYKPSKHSIDKEDIISSPTSLASASHSLTDEENSIRIDERPLTFLDYAKVPNGGKFNDRIVDDVKSLRGALVVFALLIPYFLIYSQV
jgi:hypothetical protein